MKDYETAGASSEWNTWEMRIQILLEFLKKRDNFEVLGVDVRLILTWTLKKQRVRV